MTSHAANNDQTVFRYGAHTGSYIRAEECGKRPPDSEGWLSWKWRRWGEGEGLFKTKRPL